MDIEQYIDENYDELFDHVRTRGMAPRDIDKDEIEMWVMNDERLYTEAIENGVDI